MSRRMLSAAASSALVGALAVAVGCASTTTVVGQGEDGGADATLPRPPPPPSPPGDDGAGDAGGCSQFDTCFPSCPITTDDLDRQFGWKPPHPIQNVCTSGDIQALSDELDKPETAADLIKNLSDKITNAACFDCIVSDESSAQWAPIVRDAKGALPNGGGGLANLGGCYAAFPGSSVACGKAKEYVDLCLVFVCEGCAIDQASFDACASSKALQKACAEPIQAFQAVCGGVPGINDPSSPMSRACADLVDAASTLCEGGIYDGGAVDGG